MQSKFKFGALFLALQTGALCVDAAEIQMYGQVDVGLSYSYTGVALVATGDPLPGQDASNPHNPIELESKNKHFSKLGISSGMMSPSLIGLRGTETLGNGWKVRMVLESGFNADDGSFKTADKLFDREASVTLDAGWAALSFGRLGPFRGAVGSTGLMKDNLSAFGVDGWGTVQGLAGIMGGDFKVLDNVIALEFPVSSSLSVHGAVRMNRIDMIPISKGTMIRSRAKAASDQQKTRTMPTGISQPRFYGAEKLLQAF